MVWAWVPSFRRTGDLYRLYSLSLSLPPKNIDHIRMLSPRHQWVPCITLNQTPPPSAFPPLSHPPSPALPRRTRCRRANPASSPFEPSSAIIPSTTRAIFNNKCITRQDHTKATYSGSFLFRLVWYPHSFFSLSFFSAVFQLSSQFLGSSSLCAVWYGLQSYQRVLILMLRQPISYLVLFLSLLFTYHFFPFFVSVLSFHLSLRWVLTASFLFLGRVTSDCKQVCFFTSILFCATVLFYRLIMEAHHLHFTLFEY